MKTENVAGECFGGTANMSGVHKGLAVRMKECSPLLVTSILLWSSLQPSTSGFNDVCRASSQCTWYSAEVVHFSRRQSQTSLNFPGFGSRRRPRQSDTKIIMCNEIVLPLEGYKSSVTANDKNYS